MLQSVQSERGDGGGIGVAEDAEHAAFLAQRVAFQVGILQVGILQVQIGWVEVQVAEVQVASAASSEGLCISSIAPLFWPDINVPRVSRSAF